MSIEPMEDGEIEEGELSAGEAPPEQNPPAQSSRYQQELDELHHAVIDITHDIDAREATRALEACARSLKIATRKLYAYYKTYKRLPGNQHVCGADDAPPIAQLSAPFFSALRALHIATRSDVPQPPLRHEADVVYECAWDVYRDRYVLLTSDMRREMEEWHPNNPVFRAAMNDYRASREAKRSGDPKQHKAPSPDRPPSRQSTGPLRQPPSRGDRPGQGERPSRFGGAADESTGGVEGGLSPTTPPDGSVAMSPMSADGDVPMSPLSDAEPPAQQGEAPARARSSKPSRFDIPAPGALPSASSNTPHRSGGGYDGQIPRRGSARWGRGEGGWGDGEAEWHASGGRGSRREGGGAASDDWGGRWRPHSRGGVNGGPSYRDRGADMRRPPPHWDARDGDYDWGHGGGAPPPYQDDMREGYHHPPPSWRGGGRDWQGGIEDGPPPPSRLVLVLDLDHTLLNSVPFSAVDEATAARLRALEAAEAAGGERLLFRLDAIQMWTKLRPGVFEFLHNLAPHYELWVHTNGNDAYAAAVLQLLDPHGRLIPQHRVVARPATPGGGGDGGAEGMCKRLHVALEGQDHRLVLVDDSAHVWKECSANLVLVERYLFFPSARVELGVGGPSLLDMGSDECPDRGMLSTVMDVLLGVHKGAIMGWGGPHDVRAVLDAERRRVLAGVRLTFSRVIPLEQEPSTHPLWQLAERFGATCSTVVGDDVTHVVAVTDGTDKVQWALQNHKAVVLPSWLECSCTLWHRAHEERFALAPVAQPGFA